jgi:hypothetical protein
MIYLGMDAPGTLSSHARHKRAFTTISDSNEEGDDDGNDDDDYEEEEDDK